MEDSMVRSGRILSVVAAGLMLSMGGQLANSAPLFGPSRSQNYQRIGSDRGGYVVQYALRMLKLKQSGKPVQFGGKCQSACTIYLALPRSQTCISPGASFGFHAPYGSNASGNRFARIYMLNSYPGWVRGWISSRGGLSSRVITMDYAYASKFMRICGTTTAQADFVKPGRLGKIPRTSARFG
jgi:hypothetical protein